MKIEIVATNGKAILRVSSLLIAIFSAVITFVLSGPAVSESQQLKVVNNPVAIASVPTLKQQAPEVKVVKIVSPLRKQVYAEYRRKMHNGEALLRRINQYNHIIEAAASYYGLDADLVTGLIALESGGQNSAVSSKQAKGLMQIYDAPRACTKQVKALFKVKRLDLHNPAHNIFVGTATLAYYIKIKHDPLLGLVAYNAGPGAVNVKSFSEFSNGALKKFPLIVSAYSLMAKIQKQTGRILPLNDETKNIFDGLELPGVI